MGTPLTEDEVRAQQNATPEGQLLLRMGWQYYDTESSARQVAAFAVKEIAAAKVVSVHLPPLAVYGATRLYQQDEVIAALRKAGLKAITCDQYQRGYGDGHETWKPSAEAAPPSNGHTLKICTCGKAGCQYCDGGLAFCVVCHGGEAELAEPCLDRVVRQRDEARAEVLRWQSSHLEVVNDLAMASRGRDAAQAKLTEANDEITTLRSQVDRLRVEVERLTALQEQKP